MNDKIKKAAEENNRTHPSSKDYYYSDHDNEFSFLAGASHMLKEVLKLLRSEEAHNRYKSFFNMPPFSTEIGADLTPKQWADWLEKKMGEKG